jgi:hypothetical protein
VYFGTSSPPLKIRANYSSNIYDPDLNYQTTYYWRIVAWDDHGLSSSGPIWQFTTESDQGGDPPGGGGAPPLNDPEDPPIPPENNPPDQPMKPTGPQSVKVGSEYSFSSSTIDSDGDNVRFLFDWGDGNQSKWSEYIPSYESISMDYSWSHESYYQIKVISQDDNGLNSSWSESHEIYVEPIETGQNDTIHPEITILNQTYMLDEGTKIIFDASGTDVPHGIIKSYVWDFGDGNKAKGVQQTHIYQIPGDYIVTLLIEDSEGNTYSDSISVEIQAPTEGLQLAGKLDVISIDYQLTIGCIILFLIACLSIYYRKQIVIYISSKTNRLIEGNKGIFRRIIVNITTLGSSVRRNISFNLLRRIPQRNLNGASRGHTIFQKIKMRKLYFAQPFIHRKNTHSYQNEYSRQMSNVEPDYNHAPIFQDENSVDDLSEFYSNEIDTDHLKARLEIDNMANRKKTFSRMQVSNIENLVDRLISSNSDRYYVADDSSP